MKRVLFPFLMIAHLAYAEVDDLQLEKNENPLVVDNPVEEMVETESQSLAMEMIEDKNDSLAQQLLAVKEALRKVQQLEDEHARIEQGIIAQLQAEQMEKKQQSTMSKQGCYERISTDLYASGAFLWWIAHEDGLAYASTGFNSNPTSGNAPSQSTVPRGSIRNFGNEYQPGFKVGLGYNVNSHWDIYLNWTRFRQHPSHEIKASSKNGSPLYDEWGNQAVVSGYPILSARADWKLNFNTIDLEGGRLFMPSRCVSLRPFAGLVGVIILQNYNVTETVNIPTPSAGRITNPTISIRNFNNYRGIGLRGGLNSGLHFCSDWEVFGNFAASVISGKFKVLNYQTTNDNTFPRPYMNVVDRFWSVKTELEAALGLRWGEPFLAIAAVSSLMSHGKQGGFQSKTKCADIYHPRYSMGWA